MAATRFGDRDWLYGWSVSISPGNAYIQGVTLVGIDGTPGVVTLAGVGGGAATAANPAPVVSYAPGEYQSVAVSQTDKVLGPVGAVGDYIEGLLCTVATAATSGVLIQDGNDTAIPVLPDNVAAVGSYFLPILATSRSGPWSVTTGAGVTVLATGRFT